VIRPGLYSRNISERLIWVLTDVVMPGSIDGLELAAKIHQVDPSLPVLFVTGALPEGDARAVGIVEKELLLRKPFLQSN
jgi:CheY-like chemotaxis protein